MEIIAAIVERAAIEEIFGHLGLDAQPPPVIRDKERPANSLQMTSILRLSPAR